MAAHSSDDPGAIFKIPSMVRLRALAIALTNVQRDRLAGAEPLRVSVRS